MDLRSPVVVHYKGGTIKKGYTQNFAFFRETFDLVPAVPNGPKLGRAEKIRVEDLKALFFVKHFEGNPGHPSAPAEERSWVGDRVEVTFQDNETLIGYTPRYREEDKGFILYPADPHCNNHIVAVVHSAVRRVRRERPHSYFNP